MTTALNAYLQKTQYLINDIKQIQFNAGMLTTFINIARGQISGEGECIRSEANGTAIINNRGTFFNDLVFPAGTSQVLNVRSISIVSSGGGLTKLDTVPWEYFNQYYLNKISPSTGQPTVWAQYSQGTSGSFLVDPIPNVVYTYVCDCVFRPSDLVDDSSIELLPYPWSDAVQYFSAALAYFQAQMREPAMNMMEVYKMFMARARSMSTPAVLPFQYEQSNPVVPIVPGLGAATKGG